MQKIEKYVDNLISGKYVISTNTHITTTWEECIEENKYYNFYETDINNRDFYDLWKEYIDHKVDNDASLTGNDLVNLLNKCGRSTWKAMKWFIDHGEMILYSYLRIRINYKEAAIWMNNLIVQTRSINTVHLFYTSVILNSLGYNNYYYIMFNAIVENKLPISFYIPLHIDMKNEVLYAIHKHKDDPEYIMKHFKYLVLRDINAIITIITQAHYVCDEFRSIIPDIVVDILAQRPKEEITEETFSQWRPLQGLLHPAFYYASVYKDAPPEWLCRLVDKERLMDYLQKNNISVPHYIDPTHTLRLIQCEHKDVELWYANDENTEIKCAECSHHTGTKVYNIRCPICLEEEPKNIHLFDCGHTVCKSCFTECNKCQFCVRT